MTKDRPLHHVQSLERGLTVIAAFDADHSEMTLTEVAERTGLTRSAVRRFLLTLTDLGYARRNERLFALTPRILDLGFAYLSSQTLPEISQPHLEQLVAEVNESSSVSVMDGEDIVYVARVATSRRLMAVRIDVGTRFPAVYTSMGRVMWAYLPEGQLRKRLARAQLSPITSHAITERDVLEKELVKIRERGFAIVDQELEEGLRSVAVPIHDHQREVIAAINISLQANRTTFDHIEETLVPRLLVAARDIEADLNATGGTG